jgi:1-acyl-sn-glycerol-3-phosphate acyltransferase
MGELSSLFPRRPWFYHFGNWFLRLAFRIILRVELRGLENIPRAGPAIIAISHSSFLDPLLAGAYSPRDVVPMAKIEAFNLPVFGLIVRSYGAFPVRRGEADMSAFKTALKVLQSGYALVMAPEGHRSESGRLQQGREGAIMLSLRSGAPIVPVAVWGGKAFWKNLARLRRTDVKFFVGAPVLPAITESKPTREHVAAMSDELMLRIAAMMPPEMHGYYTNWARPVAGYLQPYRAVEMATVIEQKEVANVN